MNLRYVEDQRRGTTLRTETESREMVVTKGTEEDREPGDGRNERNGGRQRAGRWS